MLIAGLTDLGRPNEQNKETSLPAVGSAYVPIAALQGGRIASLSRKRSEWTCPEERILREHYPVGGARDCVERLPGRTVNAIRMRAQALGLKAPPYRPTHGRRAIKSTEVIDDAIRRGFARQQPGFLLEIARQVARSENWIRRRAGELGIAVVPLKPKPWSTTEDRLLAHGAEKGMDIKALKGLLKREGFKRSEPAIRSRLFRIEVKLDRDAETIGRYTLMQLAVLLGIHWQTVRRWVLEFDLPATQNKPRSPHSVRRQDLRPWIMSHLALINFHTVDKFWFASLLYGQ